MDKRSAYVNKLQGELRMVFPQYLKIFSKITTNTSLTLLEDYTSPEAFLNAAKGGIINRIRSTTRFWFTCITNKYNAMILTTTDAKTFGYSIRSNFKRVRLYLRFIRNYDEEVSSILSEMQGLVSAHKDTYYVEKTT